MVPPASRREPPVDSIVIVAYKRHMSEVVETGIFSKWLKGLRDPVGRRAIVRRLARIVSMDQVRDIRKAKDLAARLE